ncbi:MAG: NUMOD3 domain-containing DNA-binding protein [Nanoarchaeota archaeon]
MRIKTCLNCKKDFILKDPRSITCSRKCGAGLRREKTFEEIYGKEKSNIIKEKMRNNHADVSSKNNPMYGKKLSEEHRRKISKKGISCSEENKKLFAKIYIQNGNPNWKGGRKIYICQNCKKEFVDTYYVNRKCCSRSCATLNQRKNGSFVKKPTKPEQTFIEIIRQNELPYKYVGNGLVSIGKRNPDFIHNEKNIVIEIFGRFWHTKELNSLVTDKRTEKGTIHDYLQNGYQCVVIWEDELQNLSLARIPC